MKTKVMVCAMVLSMAGGSALFAQTAKEVIFRIKDIPANQGKILLTTEPGQYCSAVDATSSAVELKIEDMPNGEYTVYVFHDANSNQVLDKDANQIPVERCAIRQIRVTDKKKTFQIMLKDIQKQIKDKYNPQIQISAESGTKRSIFRQKNKTKRSKKRLHTTLIKPEQKVDEDLCSGFILS